MKGPTVRTVPKKKCFAVTPRTNLRRKNNFDGLLARGSFELARKHHDDTALQMVEKQFLDSLKRVGVERFGAVGEEFNPHEHEALAMHGTEHIIQSIERSGYKTGNKIIRPAQVII